MGEPENYWTFPIAYGRNHKLYCLGGHMCDYSWTPFPCHVTGSLDIFRMWEILKIVPDGSQMDPRSTKKCRKSLTSFQKLPSITPGASPSHPEDSPWSPTNWTMSTNIQQMSKRVADKCLKMLKSKRRGPTNPEDPFNKFLKILDMGSIFSKKHEMEFWCFLLTISSHSHIAT